MKRFSLQIVSILFLLTATNLSFADTKDSIFSHDTTAKYNQILKQRRFFGSYYSKAPKLLHAYEDNTAFFKIQNGNSKIIDLKNTGLFYEEARIRKEINAADNLPPKEKIKKIFDFIVTKATVGYPIYESFDLHQSPNFFSTYSHGFCDDLATNFVYLCKLYGFKAREWWLEGHVVAEVFYDGKWHLYDPTELGILEKDGQVMGIDYWIQQAKEGKLSKFNDVFSSTENNSTREGRFLDPDPGDPYLELLPQEKDFFYSNAYMVTTDGNYVKTKLNRPEKFFWEYQDMANFVREIPLKTIAVSNDPIELKSYFPFSGVFIVSEKDLSKIPNPELPRILVQSVLLPQNLWTVAEPKPDATLKYFYLDLTAGVKNLDDKPSYKITLDRLKNLVDQFPDAKLLTVHFYYYKNADFGDTVVEKIKQNGLETTKAEA